MRTSRSWPIQMLCLVLSLWTFIFFPVAIHAESLSQEYSTVSPIAGSGSGEYVHGQKEGKILIRTLIFGAVPVQGIHYVPEGTDLLFGILYAGGYTDTSKLNGITIRRRNVADIIDVDLEDLIQSGQTVPKLSDGDIVTVPFNWRRDISTITLVTGFISSMTAFTLSLIALTRGGK